MVVLPVLSRSVSLLTLLLQNGAVDLELASSVVGLDPAMAFATLQLANRRNGAGGDRIWQLPLAVVQAGRGPLRHFVQYAPTIESAGNLAQRARLQTTACNAVVRACVAYHVTRELGTCNPHKAFLFALLFRLPLWGRCALGPEGSPAVVLSTMGRILPGSIVTGVMAGDTGSGATADPLLAAVLIADAVVKAQPEGFDRLLQELASSSLWDGGNSVDLGRRRELLNHAFEVAAWAAASLHRMDPWEFMARLESRNSWR